MAESKHAKVVAVLERAREFEERALGLDGASDLIAEAVLLCAAKVQEMTTKESVHFRAVERILTESDIGSHDALRRTRGVLRAAAQLEGLARLDNRHPELRKAEGDGASAT